jgi:hypothetical protein
LKIGAFLVRTAPSTGTLANSLKETAEKLKRKTKLNVSVYKT